MKKLFSDKKLEIYVCKELVDELETVASRPKLEKYISHKDIVATLEIIDAFCINVKIRTQAKSPIRDIKDLYLLSLADTIPADYILTGDKDLLVLRTHNQTKILTYSDFVANYL